MPRGSDALLPARGAAGALVIAALCCVHRAIGRYEKLFSVAAVDTELGPTNARTTTAKESNRIARRS